MKNDNMKINVDDILVKLHVGDEVLIPKEALGEKMNKRAFVYGIYPHHIVFQIANTTHRISFQPFEYRNFKKVSNAIYTPRTPKNLDEYYQMIEESSKK